MGKSVSSDGGECPYNRIWIACLSAWLGGGEITLVIQSKSNVYSLSPYQGGIWEICFNINRRMGGVNWRTLPGGSGPFSSVDVVWQMEQAKLLLP